MICALTLNIKKCKFGLDLVDYLGFTFEKSGVKPGTRNLRAILDFPSPMNVHEVRVFRGLASFIRRFIPGLLKCDANRITHRCLYRGIEEKELSLD